MMQNSGQSKARKTVKPRGPRQFVGPMDHSYRVANGNVADGPPSTIQLSSGESRQNHYMDASQQPAPAPVREDAHPRIFCFIEDLFFTAKIQEAARKLGVKVEFIKGGAKEDVARILELPAEQRPKLMVFDLNNLNAKPITLIPKFKTKFKKATSIVGFLSHLQGELKAKGVEAGCDTVMPRSAFSQGLPSLLRRYGLEEEEDHYPQPA
jgi:hypothetical protein